MSGDPELIDRGKVSPRESLSTTARSTATTPSASGPTVLIIKKLIYNEVIIKPIHPLQPVWPVQIPRGC